MILLSSYSFRQKKILYLYNFSDIALKEEMKTEKKNTKKKLQQLQDIYLLRFSIWILLQIYCPCYTLQSYDILLYVQKEYLCVLKETYHTEKKKKSKTKIIYWFSFYYSISSDFQSHKINSFSISTAAILWTDFFRALVRCCQSYVTVITFIYFFGEQMRNWVDKLFKLTEIIYWYIDEKFSECFNGENV